MRATVVPMLGLDIAEPEASECALGELRDAWHTMREPRGAAKDRHAPDRFF